jgi:hypothetical protein
MRFILDGQLGRAIVHVEWATPMGKPRITLTLTPELDEYLSDRSVKWTRSKANFALWLLGIGVGTLDKGHPASNVPVVKKGRPTGKAGK